VDDSTLARSPSVYLTITRIGVSVSPSSGPQGTTFNEPGTGFLPNSPVTLHFIDPAGNHTTIPQTTDGSGGTPMLL